jgi:hypothetical protein
MRFNRSFVSGFETSGDRGPSPSPCFGSQGELELVVFASSQTYSRLRIFLTESKFTIAGPCPMTPKVSFGEHRVFVDRVVREFVR